MAHTIDYPMNARVPVRTAAPAASRSPAAADVKQPVIGLLLVLLSCAASIGLISGLVRLVF